MSDVETDAGDPTSFAGWAGLVGRGAAELRVPVDAAAMRRLWDYTTALREWSQRMNLVGSAAPVMLARAHVLDSLAVLRFLADTARRCADVGTGAGLPGMVAALVDPGRHWTLIDSSRKRCEFLAHVESSLRLTNVTVRCARAEESGRDPAMREAHDAAVSRAVGPLQLAAEYCLPLVRVGGQWLALKGPAVTQELDGAMAIVEGLGGRVRGVVEYRLPLGDERRVAVVVDKVAPTLERFPRRVGIAAKHAKKVDSGRQGV